MTRAKTLLQRARAAEISIATAESCTAGLVAGAITEVAGSSDIFDRGFVTYSNQAKMDMLGVQSATLEAYGAVSEETALEMVLGAVQRSQATLAISITGIAGPGGSDHKPEGRVCFGIAKAGQEPETQTLEFGALGRAEVRQASVEFALDLLIKQAF